MLPDRERKLLRILINYPSPLHRTRVPDFKQLETMTGLMKPDILKSLQYLDQHGFIDWPNKATTEGIMVIKNEVLEKSPPKRNNIEYWTN